MKTKLLLSFLGVFVTSALSVSVFSANPVNPSCLTQGGWSAQGWGFTVTYTCGSNSCSCLSSFSGTGCSKGNSWDANRSFSNCAEAYVNSLGWSATDISSGLPEHYAQKGAACAQAPGMWKGGSSQTCQDNDAFICSKNNTGGVSLTYSSGSYNCQTNPADAMNKQCMMCRSQMLDEKNQHQNNGNNGGFPGNGGGFPGL